ncbi:MAG TPA: FHA domain-containing protein [Nocardioides sp.]|nr:FHA domain-containing protein [Nocardioides sp.]
MTASYAVGELATLVTADAVVLAAPDRLADVAALAGLDLDPPQVVEVLSRGVLSDLPDFAVVRVEGDEARVLVRGGLVVRVAGFAVDGRGATTWTEATAALAAGDVVEVVPVGTPLVGATLPLTAGVVRSAGLTWVPVAAAVTTPVTTVTTPATPAPEAAAPAPPAETPAPVPAPVPAPTFAPAPEHTVYRTPASAAAPAPPPPATPLPPTPQVAAPADGWPAAPVADPDHDGRTITPAQLQALRSGQAGAPVVPTAPPGPPAPPQPVAPPPPPLRALVALALSTGRVVPIRRRVLIGRSPRVQQVGGSANLPALVTVDDPYVSSTHLEVASDGIRVTVTDTSTNGTLLARQGRAPVALDHGVATEVAIGDVLTLSKGLTATVVPSAEG